MCGTGEVVQRGAGVAWKESVLLTVMGYMAPFQPHAGSENDLQGSGGHKKCTGVQLGVV